jgi:hypothetical protein
MPIHILPIYDRGQRLIVPDGFVIGPNFQGVVIAIFETIGAEPIYCVRYLTAAGGIAQIEVHQSELQAAQPVEFEAAPGTKVVSFDDKSNARKRTARR